MQNNLKDSSFIHWNISAEEIELLKREIQETLNNYPYKLSNDQILQDGHFVNGHYLHSNQFYFAKYYFQSSENCEKLAIIFVDKLIELKLINCTLVGLRSYTGLLLSKVQALLDNIGHKINYILIDQLEENKFTWQSIPNFEALDQNFLVILPITCSCSTYIRLRKYLQNELRELKKIYPKKRWRVKHDFINVFLIRDNFFRNKSETFYVDADYVVEPKSKYIKLNPKLSKLYSNFNWEYIEPNLIKFYNHFVTPDNHQADSPYIAHPLINLFSELSLVESCPYCFPSSGKLSDEKKIFHTHINAETPNLLLELPKFSYNINLKNLHSKHNRHISENKENTLINLFYNSDPAKQVLLYDNYFVNGRYYSDFVRGNFFYMQNRDSILNFFTDALEEILFITKVKNVVFITPTWKHNSSFLEELINYKKGEDKNYSIFDNEQRKCSVNILRYTYNEEFIDNFMSSHRQLIENKTSDTLIIFFEEVLSIGKLFKLLNDYIKHYSQTKKNENDSHGFDYVFSLVDRTTLNVRNEILRKLKSSKNIFPERNLISFFHLNVPIIAAANLGNPITEKLVELKKMINESHLDILKGYLINRLIGKNIKGLPEENSLLISTEYKLNYFSFEDLNEAITISSYEIYKNFFYSQKPNFLRLIIIHEINFFLSKTESIYNSNFIESIIHHIWDRIADTGNFFCQNLSLPNRRLDVERRIVHDNVIKILSHHPYTYYNQIYNEIFNYCLSQMESISEKTLRDGITNFIDFRNFKFYIRRLVELDSSFLISENIFEVLKRVYEAKNFEHNSITLKKEKYFLEIKNVNRTIHNSVPPLRNDEIDLPNITLVNACYKYNQLNCFLNFILFCYKESVFKNHYRSIRLEELLNSDNLLPALFRVEFIDKNELVKFIQDPYYILTSVIKTENIYLLSKLKELHKSNIEAYLNGNLKDLNPFDSQSILNYYFENWKSDPIILNAREFVGKSKFSNTGDIHNKDIKLAIANMLKCVTILKRNKKEREFSRTMKNVLESVVEIFKPSIKEGFDANQSKGSLGYALCIKYKNNSDNTNNSDDIYITSSDDLNQGAKLNPDGLIYNFMHGMYDCSEMKVERSQKHAYREQIPTQIGEQSLLMSVKIDAKYKSFQNTYFIKRNADEVCEVTFDKLYKKDIKEEFDNRGLSILRSSNLTLMFRLSDLDKTKLRVGKHEIIGKAVLIITNSNDIDIKNYNDFMNYEKVRLLMLIKEELLQYLQETTESDTFLETTKNADTIKYVSLMKHGILTYFDSLKYILNNKNTLTKNDIAIVKLVNTILETQFKNLSYHIGAEDFQHSVLNKNQHSLLDDTVDIFSETDICDLFKAILELPEITSLSIKDGYDLEISVPNFACPRAIYYHVIPELFVNIRKQTFLIDGMKAYKILYQKDCLIVENTYDPELTPNPDLHKPNGGREMCKTICDRFNIKLIYFGDGAIYRTILMFKTYETENTFN